MGEDRSACEKVLAVYVEEVLNKGNIDRLGEFIHPDFITHTDESALQLDATGDDLEGIRAGITELREKLQPVYTATVERWEGDTVHLAWTMAGVHVGPMMGFAPTGKRFKVSYTSWCRFQDGKAIEAKGEWDPEQTLAEIRRQIDAQLAEDAAAATGAVA
ncbi:ester cyclase [Dactylosporangium sp. NPDC000555]|uniref:ester cyclase n=1 Tax=Dactylosporangium sp. NPDC000555 TaxID=3154260 RepID=UPI003326EE75